MTILLPADKLTHYAVGTLIVAALLPLGWEIAAGACALAGIGREVYGAAHGGTFDLADLAATLAGGAVVLLAASIGWMA